MCSSSLEDRATMNDHRPDDKEVEISAEHI
jgi:hypothetical protein